MKIAFKKLTTCVCIASTAFLSSGVTAWASPISEPFPEEAARPFQVVGKTAENPDDEYWLPEEPHDPLEGMNREIFWFNDRLDVYVAEPVAKGYDYVVPEIAQIGLSNFFENLGVISYVLSDLVQLKFGQAGHHTSRFAINTTIGLAGFMDIARDFGLERHKEDFASALAYQGVPAGPYLVLPLFGPSNIRDGIGRIVDTLIHPFSILTYADAGLSFGVTASAFTLELIDARADLLDAVDTAKESSLDYYLFVQSAYYQYRDGVVSDGKVKRPDDDTEFED